MTIDAGNIAGSIASVLFIAAQLPMLAKAIKTKDLESYSVPHLILGNVGNVLYWAYVLSLPPGPIYFLHLFFTLSTAVMLLCWLKWERKSAKYNNPPTPSRDF